MDYKFRQRVLVDVDNRSLKSKMLDQDVSMPVALAPVGLTGMQWVNGDCAAEEFGVPFCLSTMSICSIEDVANSVHQPFWFQLYVMRDRDYIKRLILRAKAACSALILTVDLRLWDKDIKTLKTDYRPP